MFTGENISILAMAAKQQKLEIPAACNEMWQNFSHEINADFWGHLILLFCVTLDVEAIAPGYQGNKKCLLNCVKITEKSISVVIFSQTGFFAKPCCW